MSKNYNDFFSQAKDYQNLSGRKGRVLRHHQTQAQLWLSQYCDISKSYLKQVQILGLFMCIVLLTELWYCSQLYSIFIPRQYVLLIQQADTFTCVITLLCRTIRPWGVKNLGHFHSIFFPFSIQTSQVTQPRNMDLIVNYDRSSMLQKQSQIEKNQKQYVLLS